MSDRWLIQTQRSAGLSWKRLSERIKRPQQAHQQMGSLLRSNWRKLKPEKEKETSEASAGSAGSKRKHWKYCNRSYISKHLRMDWGKHTQKQVFHPFHHVCTHSIRFSLIPSCYAFSSTPVVHKLGVGTGHIMFLHSCCHVGTHSVMFACLVAWRAMHGMIHFNHFNMV